MKRRPHLLNIVILLVTLCVIGSVRAQQQASVAVFPFGALSGGERWIAAGISRDLIEKLVRTPELRPASLESNTI